MELTGRIKNQRLSQCFRPGLVPIYYLYFSACDHWLLETLVIEYLCKKLFLSKKVHIPRELKYFNVLWQSHPSCNSATL